MNAATKKALVDAITLLLEEDAYSAKVADATCGAATKAGTACKNEAKACRHHKAAPKAKAPKAKAAPKVHRRTEAIGEGKALTKATRQAFIKAYKAQFGRDLKGMSTKQVATVAIAEARAPKGYRVGAGYYELLG